MKNVTTMCLLAAMFVFCSNVQAVTWNVPGDFATIQDAIDNISDGDSILVGAGNHMGATVTKAVEIRGEGGAVISSGPLLWPGHPSRGTLMAGFHFASNGGGDGATITHLAFETVEFPVMSRGADNITVDYCTMTKPVQGITNWHGDGWNVSHNVIIGLQTRNGGGIGVLCGAVMGGTSNGNVISHNKMTGRGQRTLSPTGVLL